MSETPLQPIVTVDGVIRFEANPLVRLLYAEASAGRQCDLNRLAETLPHAERRHWEQLAMLLGYSLAGFAELSYVSDQTYAIAEEKAASMVNR